MPLGVLADGGGGCVDGKEENWGQWRWCAADHDTKCMCGTSFSTAKSVVYHLPFMLDVLFMGPAHFEWDWRHACYSVHMLGRAV
jgi:hypothetical protein